MKRHVKRAATALAALTLTLGAVSCGSDPETPEWWPDPEPEPDPEPVAGKPRFIWVDAAANFPDFANSRENIARDLAKARDAGFTDIVVDVRPTTGDALFRTSAVEQVEWLGAWLPEGYSKIERTATWDYLQAFIDEGAKLGLRIHAAINTFTGGNLTSLGGAGVVFRDADKRAWTTDLNLANGITNIMSTDQAAKFFNPVLPEVQEYICSMLRDLAAYDGLTGIFLDRGRFDGFTSDFSDYTRREFEKYIGEAVADFPGDILPAGHTSGIPSPEPVRLKQWIEFRAKVIRDFMAKARAAVKEVNPSLRFGQRNDRMDHGGLLPAGEGAHDGRLPAGGGRSRRGELGPGRRSDAGRGKPRRHRLGERLHQRLRRLFPLRHDPPEEGRPVVVRQGRNRRPERQIALRR